MSICIPQPKGEFYFEWRHYNGWSDGAFFDSKEEAERYRKWLMSHTKRRSIGESIIKESIGEIIFRLDSE